jgi:hypothetical protein
MTSPVGKLIAIHQPEYFPWLGFLDKARQVDAFVLLDSVQFDRSSLQHRSKILGPNGPVWLTIPFRHKFPQRVDEVTFADPRWASKHLKSIQAAYGRAAGFKTAFPKLEALFTTSYERVADVAIASVELLFQAFGVRPPEVVRSSSLEVAGEKAELVLDICRALGATRYLSGRTGAGYLAEADVPASGVEIIVQSFAPKPYPRRAVSDEDARGLSALDAWLNLGDEAATYFDPREGTT